MKKTYTITFEIDIENLLNDYLNDINYSCDSKYKLDWYLDDDTKEFDDGIIDNAIYRYCDNYGLKDSVYYNDYLRNKILEDCQDYISEKIGLE